MKSRFISIPDLPYACAAAAGVWLLKVIFFLVTSIRVIAMTPWTLDDSFIIARVARNIALGKGFSFDGIHPTTGSTFLWTCLSSLNHLVFPRDFAAKMVLVESSLFGALATVLVFILAFKLSEKRSVAWIAFVLSSFSAAAFFNAMNGMETGLFTFCVLLTITVWLFPLRSDSPMLSGCITGACAGITFLTRADGLFLILAIGLLQLFTLYRTRSTPACRKAWHYLLGFVLAAGIAFILMSLWQFLVTGSIVPANQGGRRGLAVSLHGFSFQHFSLFTYLKIGFWNVFQLEHLLTIATGSFLLGFVSLLYCSMQRTTAAFARVTLLYAGLFLGMLAFYQWYFPDFHGLRYVNPAAHLLFICIALLIDVFPAHKLRPLALTCAVLSILAVSFYDYREMANRMPWETWVGFTVRPTQTQIDKFWGQIDWIAKNIPAGTVIAARDHGRLAFFTDASIQDLSGIIDPMAAKSWHDGTLARYLKNRKVSYLYMPSLENRDDELNRLLHTTLSLTLVPGVPVSKDVNLYAIDWSKSRLTP